MIENIKIRVLVFILDFFIVFTSGMLIASIIVLFKRNIASDSISIFLSIWYIIGIMCKDFSGQSIGKRIAKIKIISTDGYKAQKYKLILRNITCFIWPIELLVVALSEKHVRFSDKLLGLRVIKIN